MHAMVHLPCSLGRCTLTYHSEPRLSPPELLVPQPSPSQSVADANGPPRAQVNNLDATPGPPLTAHPISKSLATSCHSPPAPRIIPLSPYLNYYKSPCLLPLGLPKPILSTTAVICLTLNQITKLNTTNNRNFTQKLAKDINTHFSKENLQMANAST
jgi:hypothetical protein